MSRCPACKSTLPQEARFCRTCGYMIDTQKKKKQRSFFIGLLLLLGIRYNPAKDKWGCAFLPATITVAIITLVVAGIVVGPVEKLYPPFSSTSSSKILSHTTITFHSSKTPTSTLQLAGITRDFPLPTPNSEPFGIAAGPDGNLWFTECISIQGTCSDSKVGRITPHGQITEFPTPTKYSDPTGITAGPDGNLWFTDQAGNLIGYITSGK